MPDNPTDKPSNEPTPDASLAGDLGDIDGILSRASRLADELAEQVGVSDDHTYLSQDDYVEAFNKVSDDIRNEEFRKANTTESETLNGSKYLLLKNWGNLERDQSVRLEEILATNRRLNTVYWLKDLLVHIWDHSRMDCARAALGQWCAVAREDGHPDLVRFARTLERYEDGNRLETKEPEAAPTDYKAAAAALGDTLADSPEPEVAESVADAPQTPPTESTTEGPAPPDVTPPSEDAAQLGKRESDASAEGKDAGDAVASTAYELSPDDLADGEGFPSFEDVPAPEQSDGGTPTSPPAQEGARETNAVGAICMALEVIDAPFQRVREMPRRVIGWSALALLFAAFLIFVLSFFQ